jgi:hypothetical protein
MSRIESTWPLVYEKLKVVTALGTATLDDGVIPTETPSRRTWTNELAEYQHWLTAICAHPTPDNVAVSVATAALRWKK